MEWTVSVMPPILFFPCRFSVAFINLNIYLEALVWCQIDWDSIMAECSSNKNIFFFFYNVVLLQMPMFSLKSTVIVVTADCAVVHLSIFWLFCWQWGVIWLKPPCSLQAKLNRSFRQFFDRILLLFFPSVA